MWATSKILTGCAAAVATLASGGPATALAPPAADLGLFDFTAQEPTRVAAAATECFYFQPSCASKADTPEESDRVYGGQDIPSGCIDPGGPIRGLTVGPARLGRTRAQLRRRIEPPSYSRGRVDAWCLAGKGELRLLTRAEWQGGLAMPSGEALLFAFYLNELLVRLLMRFS